MKSKLLFSVILLVLIASSISTARVNAAAANLDPSFGKGGLATTTLTSGYFSAQNMALQPDGKIVLAGTYYDGSNSLFGLLRVNPDGTLDPTFGNFGIASTPPHAGASASGFGVAIQPDGKIVEVGNVYQGTPGTVPYYIARFNTDGTLDTGFGANSNGTIAFSFFGRYDVARSVMIQGDGKIVVFGYSYNGAAYVFSATRFTPTGGVDTAFGPNGNGKVYNTIGSGGAFVYSAITQSDGKFVAVGTSQASGLTVFTIARYTADGSLDSGFGSSGVSTTAITSSTSIAFSVAQQADGKLVAAGWAVSGTALVYGLARYATNGSLDTSFGSGGKLTTAIGTVDDEAYGVAVQGNGKVLVAGWTWTGSVYAIGLLRYDSNGTLDTSFGNGGKDIQHLGTNGAFPSALALQQDGKILVGGSVGSQTFVARFQGDPPVDNIAPTWPTGSNLTATQLSSASVFLTWTPATDDVSVSGYRVYQGSTLIATLPSTASSYLVTGLTQGSSYTFKVQAGDPANNWSANGPSASVSLPAPPAPPSFLAANLPWLILIAVVIGFGVALVLTKPKAPKMG